MLVAGGAGAVGNAAIQLARWSDARVITTISSPAKAQLAAAAGADHVIDYRQQDVEREVRKVVPHGVDAVVEVAPAANAALDAAVLARHGSVAMYADNAGAEFTLPVRALMAPNARWQFVLVYTEPSEAKLRALDDIATAVADGVAPGRARRRRAAAPLPARGRGCRAPRRRGLRRREGPPRRRGGVSTPSRLELRIAEMAPRSVYPWLTASLIPRPIAWVSSTSAAGVDNLAPHSFTTVAATDPPTVCFVSIGAKDTLANVRATGEFVLNIGSEHLLAAMNDSATPFPPEISEFDEAGLAREPSAAVAPPRVAGAAVCFECRAAGEHVVGRDVMVFGEVVHLAVARGCLADDGLPDPVAVAPLSRLGRSQWARLGEVVDRRRITYDQWQDGRRTS